MLVDHVIKCSKLNYRMTYKKFRQLTYVCGRRLRSKFSSSWIDNKIAGIDWFMDLMKETPKIKFSSGPPRSKKQT